MSCLFEAPLLYWRELVKNAPRQTAEMNSFEAQLLRCRELVKMLPGKLLSWLPSRPN